LVPYDNPEKILELFNRIDTDKSGAIDPDEFRALVRDMHLKLDDEDIMALYTTIDLDKNGTIEFNEFLTWWLDSVSGYSSMSDAAWQIRLGISEAELEAATGLMHKKKDSEDGEEKKDEDDEEKKEEKDKDKEEKKEEKKPEKKAEGSLKWTNADNLGEKWHVPGTGKKEKGLQGVQYCKSEGVVALRGCLISEGEANAVAFTLPAEFAPKAALRFTAFVNTGKRSATADVVISPDGKVTVSSTAAGEFWFSGISFDQ